jgi:3-hydroxybutyrate dehydrogenase
LEEIKLDFTGKVVLITGAAGGIGKETAKLFYQEGATLSLVDVSEEALNKAIQELNFQHGRYTTIVADVSNEDQVKNYVQKTVDTYGKIDVFFNNAGIEGRVAPIVDQSDEDLTRVLNINIKGVFFGLKHVISVMLKQKSGAIVNTASGVGLVGSPGLSPYVASKHAVIGLTKTAAIECGELGIRVNAICPAPINTRMMRSIEEGAAPGRGEEARQQYSQGIPLKRYGEANEVAQLVAFLASDKASYITGSAYPVDGGMTAM